MKRISTVFLALFATWVFLSGPTAAGELLFQKADLNIRDDGSERICLFFNSAFSPHLFVLEGERPRVVVDVPNISRWSGKSKEALSGELAMRIRCHFHREAKTLRIVVDLKPALDFVVDPTLDKNRHALCLLVRKDLKKTGRESEKGGGAGRAQ